jgi:hypothetical protein
LLSKNKDLFRGAILENTFTTISEMIDNLFPIFKIFPIMKAIAIKIKWNNLEALKNINLPILFINGDSDTFVS